MSTVENKRVLDFEALLAPVDPDRPCGKSKELDQDQELLKSFTNLGVDFSEARNIEKSRRELELLTSEQRTAFLETNTLPKETPKWQEVVDLSVEILTKHSKDTRIVANLMEAICWVHGFPGLRDALELCDRLIQRYDESLFPSGDQYYRYKFFNNLNTAGAFLEAINRISFIPDLPFHWAGYQVAKHIESMSLDEQRAQREAGKLSLDDFAAKLQKRESAEIQAYGQAIAEAIDAAKKLDSTLRTLTAKLDYGIGKVLNQLVEVQDWFGAISAEFATIESEAQSQPEATSTSTSAAPAESKPIDNLRSRDEALNSLLKVAKYFRTTEPHSPLSYALEQAVRWGKMGLPDLLQDLVQDPAVLDEVYRRMGIQKKQENNDSN